VGNAEREDLVSLSRGAKFTRRTFLRQFACISVIDSTIAADQTRAPTDVLFAFRNDALRVLLLRRAARGRTEHQLC
jgi:hypothetical protein